MHLGPRRVSVPRSCCRCGSLTDSARPRGSTPSTGSPTARSISPSAWLAAVSADPEVLLLVRIHSECFTGDVLGREWCDCGPQLLEAVRRIAQVGVIVAERVPTAVQPRRPAEAHTRWTSVR
jgi:hypothetical protein